MVILRVAVIVDVTSYENPKLFMQFLFICSVFRENNSTCVVYPTEIHFSGKTHPISSLKFVKTIPHKHMQKHYMNLLP